MEHIRNDGRPVPEKRAARRALARATRKKRAMIGLAAALVTAAGLLLFAFARTPLPDVGAFAPVADADAEVTAAPDSAATPDAIFSFAIAIPGKDAVSDAGINLNADAMSAEGVPPESEGMPAAKGLSGTDNASAPTQPPVPADLTDMEPVTLTLSAVGDCTLGGDPAGRNHAAFARAFKNGGAEYFFKNVRSVFEADDVTIVNLEGPLTNKTRHRKKEFAFKGDPAYAKILTAGSVEVANLANNHAKDYYEAGLNDTAAALKKAGVARCGWGRAAILEVKGVKLGFCGFGIWFISKKGMQKEIEALAKECDLVVASIHGGEEGEGRALKPQRDYARAAVNAGAKLVLMHHPHVIGAIEVYKGATILYSLGNFCFGGNGNPEDKDTFIFQQTFSVNADGVTPAESLVIPCSISGSKSKNDFQPRLLTGDDASRVLTRIEKLSKSFDTPIDLTASRARLKTYDP